MLAHSVLKLRGMTECGLLQLVFNFLKIFKAKIIYEIRKMKLNPNCLNIDSRKISKKIEKFIKEKVKEFKKNGIVIGISGGIDSTTVLKLCINAIGKNKVTGIILSEKGGNPDAEKYAKYVTRKFGIKTKTIDLSKSLENLGVYNFPLSFLPGRKLKEFAVRKFMRLKKDSFSKSLTGKEGLFLKARINSNAKQRMRLVYLYYFAEQNNLLVAGSAHRTEDFTGLFVKFGIDNLADIMPLKDLYRTQILQISEFIRVPEKIIKRTPNIDVMPGVEDKYNDLLGINYDVVDLILYGLDKGIKIESISEQLEVNKKHVKKIKWLIEYSTFLREGSLYPKIN